MQIKYRYKKGSLLKTNCPYFRSFFSGEVEYKMSPKVGSGYCKSECEYFVEVDEDNQIVECKYENS